MSKLPDAVYPTDIFDQICAIGVAWAVSSTRPRILPGVKQHWDSLIDEWAESDFPLVIRKGTGTRGQQILHHEGRSIVIADNSPAQWAFMLAFQERLFSLGDIEDLIKRDEIPFAFATSAVDKEQMTYKRTVAPSENLNKLGWKLCHIDPVGLRSREPIEKIAIGTLKDQFRLLLKPSNMFLIPIEWSGLGELQEVIEQVRKVEQLDSAGTAS